MALTLNAVRSHASSTRHNTSLADIAETAMGEHVASLESCLFAESAASSATATLKNEVSRVRMYAVGAWARVASGMLAETLYSALKLLQRAMGICGHLGSSSHAHKKLPALYELRDVLLRIFSKTPSMMLVIDGGDAKFGDGRTSTGAC